MFRPLLADPPLVRDYTDLVVPGRLTLDDLADMHELLDYREAMLDRAAERNRG